MIRSVIFDIGGVLADDVWEHLLLDKEVGVASIYNLDIRQVEEVGRDLWERFAYLSSSKDRNWRELEREYWNLFADRLCLSVPSHDFVQLTKKFIRPLEGMTGLLESLQLRGIDLAVCSNNTEFWFERQRFAIGLDRFVDPDRVILSSRVHTSKSDPSHEMFRAAVNALGLEKESCVFVDDRENNIDQSLRFGITGILCPSGSSYGAEYLEALLKKMGVL